MIPQTSTSRLQKGYSILFLALPFFAMAQDSFNDNVDDVTPAAPIVNYILTAMLLGVYLAFRFFKTYNSIKTKN
jgi:hypothetical protein